MIIQDINMHTLCTVSLKTFEKFKRFKAEVEKQLEESMSRKLRSEHGGEYLDGEFKWYLKDNMKLAPLTPLETFLKHEGVIKSLLLGMVVLLLTVLVHWMLIFM